MPFAARRLWSLYEPVHAVTYFVPEAAAAATALGLRGFWAGYVVLRAAPLGRVEPAAVTAAFFGFAPSRAERVLPAAWEVTTPAAALEARRRSAATALRRLAPPLPAEEAADLAWTAAQACDTAGRVLAAANRALPRPDDPVEAVWQAATTLREHRGDGHLAALVAAGLDPVEALQLKAASGEAPDEQLRLGRAWTEAAWAEGRDRLVDRGLLTAAGALTPTGVDLRAEVERVTDRLAAAPWEGLGAPDTDRLAALLRPVAEAVARETLPYPNPIGVARPG